MVSGQTFDNDNDNMLHKRKCFKSPSTVRPDCVTTAFMVMLMCYCSQARVEQFSVSSVLMIMLQKRQKRQKMAKFVDA